MIRPINKTIEDLEAIGIYGGHFAEAADAGPYDAQSLISFVIKLLDSNVGQVFVMEVDGKVRGAVGLYASKCFYHSGITRVQELFWWVEPEYRDTKDSIRLFNKIEEWSKEKGAYSVMVSSTANLNPEQLERFYNKRGFRKVDINFVKEINNA